MIDLANTRILLTGAHGFLGGYVYEQLLLHGAKKSHVRTPSINELDLRIPENCTVAVRDIDLVIHLAANVGGIGYNVAHPGALFYDNAKMGIDLIERARLSGVQKFVQVGTVCAYPRTPPNIPFREEDLWEGYPEESNAPYGIAKKLLMVQLQAYRAEYGFNGIYLVPTNLYGPRDNFDSRRSHVVPALVRRFIEALRDGLTEVVVWGTGTASREFIFAEDAARGIVLAAMRYDKPDPVNLGSSVEIDIRFLVDVIARKTGFSGNIIWDSTKPDGQPRRKLDISRAEREFGFRSRIDFEDGITRTVEWYLQHGRATRSPSIIANVPAPKSAHIEAITTMATHIAVTYANDSGIDGAGAQLQRIYGTYALSRFLEVPYVHSPLMRIGYHGLSALENNSPYPDLESRYNSVFAIPSDIELPERRVVRHMTDADAQQILALQDASRSTGEFCLVRILYPYPITDRNPETYRHVTAISPFEPVRSDVFRLAIHVRRGEVFLFESDRMLPNAYYVSCALRVVRCLHALGIPFVCELYTEVPTKPFVVTPQHHWMPGLLHENATLDPEQNHLQDFEVIPNLVKFLNGDPIETLARMATADGLMLSHSSYSYVAAILNRNGTVLYHPFWHNPLQEWLKTDLSGAVPEIELMERLKGWKRERNVDY